VAVFDVPVAFVPVLALVPVVFASVVPEVGRLAFCPGVGWNLRSMSPEVPFPGGTMGCGCVAPGCPGGMGRSITKPVAGSTKVFVPPPRVDPVEPVPRVSGTPEKPAPPD
jgi:hypothetical protein